MILIATAIIAVCGAVWSAGLREEGSSWLPVIGTGIAASVTWILLVRSGRWNLLVSTLAWDATYNLAWVATTLAIEGGWSARHLIGAGLVVAGLLLAH